MWPSHRRARVDGWAFLTRFGVFERAALRLLSSLDCCSCGQCDNITPLEQDIATILSFPGLLKKIISIPGDFAFEFAFLQHPISLAS